MEWISVNDRLPENSDRSNPVWIYSKKYDTVTLGYFSGSYFYNMQGDGTPCKMWAELTKPEPPKQ